MFILFHFILYMKGQVYYKKGEKNKEHLQRHKQAESCPERDRFVKREACIVTGGQAWGLAAVPAAGKGRSLATWSTHIGTGGQKSSPACRVLNPS